MTTLPSLKISDLELFKRVLTASCYDESAWQFVDAPPFPLTSKFKPKQKLQERWFSKAIAILREQGHEIVRTEPFDECRRQSGNDWPMFGYTMVGHKRLDNLHHCIKTVLEDEIPGDIIETGVWRGGAMMFAKAVLDFYGVSDRKIWCADSFQGLPEQYDRDLKIGSDPELSGMRHLSVSQEEVADNFKRFDLLDERVEFLAGWFKDTLPQCPVDRIAIARLDGDLFESTMDALVNLYPKVVNGGFVIIDDYGSWKGCSTAVDEFRADHGITTPLQEIDMHGWFWRVSK